MQLFPLTGLPGTELHNFKMTPAAMLNDTTGIRGEGWIMTSILVLFWWQTFYPTKKNNWIFVSFIVAVKEMNSFNKAAIDAIKTELMAYSFEGVA